MKSNTGSKNLVLRRDVGGGAQRIKRSVAGSTFTKLTRKLATRYFSSGQIDFQPCGLSFLVCCTVALVCWCLGVVCCVLHIALQHSIFFVDDRDEGLQLINY
jgi:hypothetical protein